MFKKIILFSFLFFIFSTQAHAHSTLVGSNPEEDSIVDKPISTITITFNTDIDKIMEMVLENDENNKISPYKTTIDHDTISVLFDSELPNDTYKLSWTVIGTDGHPIDGHLPFTVNANKSENKVSNTVTDKNKEVNHQESDKPKQTESSTSTPKENSTIPFYLYAILPIIILIVFITFFKKGKKR